MHIFGINTRPADQQADAYTFPTFTSRQWASEHDDQNVFSCCRRCRILMSVFFVCAYVRVLFVFPSVALVVRMEISPVAHSCTRIVERVRMAEILFILHPALSAFYAVTG